jgi:SAM-dependent methyltransferase
MKVLFFSMNAPGVLSYGLPMLRCLGSIADVTVVDYWSLDLFPLDTLLNTRLSYLTLTDGGFDTIPRLSRRQYIRLCGDDIDFDACASHRHVNEGYPITRDALFADSMPNQRLRGMAYRIECLLRACSPDVVIAQQGSEPVSKLICAKSLKLSIPLLLWESSFFPGRFLLDSSGMHFFPGENRIDRLWPSVKDQPLDAAQRQRLEDYCSEWRSQQKSKYPQSTNLEELAGLQRWLEGQPAGTHVAFFPGQIPHDANVITGLKHLDGYAELIAAVEANVPPGWCVVHKVHPGNVHDTSAPVPTSERFFVVRDVSIHDLLARADAVIAHSSNVGMEALIYGKPVISLGCPYYGRKGLTLDPGNMAQLGETLDTSVAAPFPKELRDRFLHHVLFNYLIEENDADALRRRLEEGRGELRISKDGAHAPFCSHYPERNAAYLSLIRKYDSLSRENYGFVEILALMRDEPVAEPFRAEIDAALHDAIAGDLQSGERQVAGNVSQIRADHVLRYQFAEAVLEEGCNVLDFACGVGYGSFIISGKSGSKVTAVDASPTAIGYARRHWAGPNIEYVCGSPGSWRPSAGQFDAIVSFETLEHMADGRKFLHYLWRALAPGGVLLCSAPHLNYNPLTDNPFHIEHYSAASVNELLSELRGMEASVILGETERPSIRSSLAGRFLLFLALKAGGSKTADEWREFILGLLPFTSPAEDRGSPPMMFFHASELLTADPRLLKGDTILSSRELRRELGLAGNGLVSYGPYCTLEQGSYELQFQVEVEHPGPGSSVAECDIRVKLSFNAGRDVILERGLHQIALPDGRYALHFELPGQVENFETVVSHHGAGVLRFRGFALRRQTNGHQAGP